VVIALTAFAIVVSDSFTGMVVVGRGVVAGLELPPVDFQMMMARMAIITTATRVRIRHIFWFCHHMRFFSLPERFLKRRACSGQDAQSTV